jgi:hypothetical protein
MPARAIPKPIHTAARSHRLLAAAQREAEVRERLLQLLHQPRSRSLPQWMTPCCPETGLPFRTTLRLASWYSTHSLTPLVWEAIQDGERCQARC